MFGGAVVLFQPDHLCAGEILFKPQDIAHLGTAPAVDRLVVIADAADVFMPRGQEPQPEVLGDVGILIFVHEDVAEPAVVLRQKVRVILENLHAVQQEVAKIDRVQLLEAGLILIVKLGAAMIIGRRIPCGHLGGRQRAVFPVVDNIGQHPRGPALVVDARRRDELFQQADLVVGIQNGEVGFQPHQLRMTAQELDADRVEGAKPGHALGGLAEHATHAFLHFAGGLVGEGHREDLVGARPVGGQQMHDTGGQRLGLASARARQHQHRAVQRFHRLALGRVEALHIGRGARGHGAGGQRCALKGVHFVKCAHAAILTCFTVDGKRSVHAPFRANSDTALWCCAPTP